MSFEVGDNLTTVLLALFALAGPIVAAIAAYYARQANAKAVQTHDLVNSRMSELLTLTRASSRAEGVIAGATGELPVMGTPPSLITTRDAIPPAPPLTSELADPLTGAELPNHNVTTPIDPPAVAPGPDLSGRPPA